MGVLAWAATEARLKGFAFCPLAGERVCGCAVEWLSRSFDAMSPTHKFDVEVTDLATGIHMTFSVIRKQRTYRATGRTTVRYNTPVGNFGTFDEVNDALVAEALAAAAARAAEVEGEGVQAEAEPEVLAAPERHAQPEQRHYAQEAVSAKLRMGRKTLLPLREAAEKARAEGGRIVGFEHDGQIVGYRVYVGWGRNAPDAMSDCEPGWGVRYQGEYKAGRWFAGRTIESQPLIPDPLGDFQQHQQPEQQQAQREVELFPRRSVAMLVESRFTRQDGALIPPEQRLELDDQMFEQITQFNQQYRLNVEGQALFEHPEGPTAQVEQQQAQALAVAVAGFEPECDRCGALLDERGNCPVCAPRWRPCETGVRHAQTIPATREQAYREHEKTHAAAHAARKQGADPARQRRLDEASQDAWTAFKRWKDADNFAARAGAHDHLRWADL